MSDQNSQLAERPQSVKDYLALPAYKDRFQEVLKSRAPQFMAAITSLSNTPALKDAEPRSVIAAAMVAATLDLPVNPTLGQAFVVAYGDGSGNKVAQFQLGYRGYIQLALRSGQYKRINAGPVNAAVFCGYDFVGEPSLDWSKYDPTAEITGYFCAFETLNGFQKVVYWSKAQVEQHARRFSKAFQKGYKSSPWFSDFDAMATKTVIKNALTKWGVLSIEMQKAAIHDQTAQGDLDDEPRHVDDGSDRDAIDGDPKPARPAPPPRAKKGAAAVKETIVEAQTEPVKETPAAQPEPEKPVQSFADAAAATEQPEPKSAVTAVPGNPRAFLSDGETINATVKISTVEAKAHDKGVGVIAAVSGDYNGEVRHRAGGVMKDGKPEPLPVWMAGKTVALKLTGKKVTSGPQSGKVIALVESVVEASAAAQQAEEVEQF